MKVLVLIFVSAVLGWNCGPFEEPCSLKQMNEEIIRGNVLLCTGDPDNIDHFECWIQIQVIASTVSFSLTSVDPAKGFSHSMNNLPYKCVLLEDEIRYVIFDSTSVNLIGETDGKSILNLNLKSYLACPNSSSFEAVF